jgi:hypothetical protein
MEQIDYTKVKEKIVEQAYDSAFRMSEEQTRKLIQDKFERAEAHYNALKASPLWHTDA